MGKSVYPKLPDKASSFDDKPTSAKKDQGMSDLFIYSVFILYQFYICVK